MVEPAHSPAALAAFGRWLVQERELRGMSREEIARATKLAPGVVEALESGEEPRMPPRAYVVGYLRAYSAAAGLDPHEVILRYEEAVGPPGEPGRRGRRISARAVLAVVLAAAVVVAGALVLLGR